MNTSVARRTLSQYWRQLANLPLGKHAFSWMVGRMARYTGSIGAVVEELGPGYAKVSMRDRPAVRNHLGSVHAIALMNLGEVATGLAVMHDVDGQGRGIVTNLSMDYLKKARGTIVAECRTEVPSEPGEHDHMAHGELTDSDGEVVARAHATWRIQIG